MKITKKILTVVLALMMLSSMMFSAYAATFSDVDETHARYTAISTLADMGIINGYTDGTFKPDNAVTRAEMAKLITMLYGYDVNSIAASPFSDVANDHWAVSYIATMKDVGIINGMGDGTFQPNNEVTYEQSIKMIVCALNWGEVAAQSSTPADWSLGYRNMAIRLGITKNVVVGSNSEPASRSTIAQLLYNSLDAKPAERVVDSSGNVSYKESSNSVMQETQSMYEISSAFVESTPEINTNPNTMLIKAGFVRLRDMSGKTYDMSVGNNKDILNYIGRYVDVKYQVDSSDNMTVVSYSPIGTSQQIDIRKLKSVSASSIEYYSDDEYERTSKINVNNPVVMYNNRILSNAADFVTLLEKDAGLVADADDVPLNYFGTIDLVDAPAGDFIVVKAYKSYYMSTAVDTTNYLVSLDGLTAKVNIPVKDTINHEIKKKNKLEDAGTTPTSLSITTNSVVTLSMSPVNSIGTKYIEFFSNSSKKTGTPTEVTITPNRSDKGIIVIGTETLKITNDVAAAQFEVGSSTTYLTDASGAIVYVTSVTSGNKRFGFFMSAKENDDKTLTAIFYDPETTNSFTVTIQDEDDINDLSVGKADGSLFWMNITSGSKVKKGDLKLAKEVTKAIDANLDADVQYNCGDTVELSSSQFVLSNPSNNEKPKYATTNSTIIIRPDVNDLASSKLEYSKLSALSSGVKYGKSDKKPLEKAEIYEIKRNNKTYVFLVVNAFKGLQQGSNVYVVKAEPLTKKGSGENEYYDVETYNFKTGAEVTTPLKIATSVYDTLELKEGDVFTFYDDRENLNVDIDKTENVYVLLRASELAADKTKAKDLKVLTSDQTANVYSEGFRTFGIYQADTKKTYYSYTLQVPIYVDNDDSRVYFARGAGSTSVTPQDLKTYVHGDDITSVVSDLFSTENWSSDIVEKFGSDVTNAEIKSSVKVFIYDKALEDGKKLTVYKAPSSSGEVNEIEATINSITSLQHLDNSSAEAFEANLHSASLTYTYVTTSTNGGTLNALYIIK